VVAAALSQSQTGVFNINYTVSDSSHNSASILRAVYVTARVPEPVSFEGVSNITVNAAKSMVLSPTFLPTPYAFLDSTQAKISGVRQYGSDLVNLSRLGMYDVLFVAIDAAGNFGTFTTTVSVVDEEPPQIVFAMGPSSFTLDVAATFAYPPVNVSDNYDASEAVLVELIALPASRVVGSTLTFAYRAVDTHGNAALLNGSVFIVDTSPPVISLAGSNPALVNYGTSYVEDGATASDVGDGLVFVKVLSSTINTQPSFVPVNLSVVYQATDSHGNVGTATRIVTIVDTLPPIISLVGNASTVLEAGALYVESGAVAFDLLDKSVNVVISNGNLPLIHAKMPISYDIVYEAEDSHGNVATLRRNVTFIDRTRPTLKLRGSESIVHEAGTPYMDSGATAFDSYAGDRTAQITSTFFRVDRGQLVTRVVSVPSIDVLNVGGLYQVVYSVNDPSDNAAFPLTRNVSIVDITAPMLELTVPAITYLEAARPSVPYVILGAVAFDAVDGNLTSSIFVNVTSTNGSSSSLSFINTAAQLPAKYVLRFSVSDSSGNAGNAVQREVILRDTTAPFITLQGASPLVLERFAVVADPYAVAYDSYDGDITSRLSSSWSQVNTSAPGGTAFTVIYQVTDTQGNSASPVSRIVMIKSPSSSSSSSSNTTVAVIACVVVILVIMIVVLIVWVIWQRRDRKQRRELQKKFYETYTASPIGHPKQPVLHLHGYGADEQIYSEINDEEEFAGVQAVLQRRADNAQSPPLPERNGTLSFVQGRPQGDTAAPSLYDSLQDPEARRESILRHRDIEHLSKPWFQEKLDREVCFVPRLFSSSQLYREVRRS
jgi:hypothetical protein